MRFMIGDTETTGLVAPEACEIALLEVDADLEIVAEAEALLNPGKPISKEAAEIHGITEEMVANCQTKAQWVESSFGGPIEGQIVLIGYRISYDRPMLEPVFDKIVSQLDVLPMAQSLFPDAPNHKLSTMKEYLQLEGGTAHRAMGDVLTTLVLLRTVCKKTGRTLTDMVNTPFTFVHRQPWGKHAGTLLVDLPAGYRRWMLEDCKDLDPNLRRSLEMVATTDYRK